MKQILGNSEENLNGNKTIKGKIRKVTVQMLIVSLLIVGGISCILNYWTLYRTMEHSLQTTAQVAAGQVNYHLTAKMNSVEVVGGIKELTDEDVTVKAKQKILDEYAKHFGCIFMYMTDKNGIGIGKSDFNVSGEDYYQQAIKGKTVITDPVYNEEAQGLVVIIATPLWQNGDFDTEVAGTVIAVLNAKDLSDIIAKIRIGRNGGAYVINKEGTEIGAEFYEFVEQQWNTIEESKKDSSLKALAKIEKKMIKGESGFASYFFQGTPKYIGYVPVGINEWSIGVTAPITDYLDGTIWSVLMTIIVLLIMSMFGKKIATRLGSEIGDAVCICADRLQLLAKGDLSAKVETLHTDDETKILENSTRAILETQQTIIGDIRYLLHEMSNSNFDVYSKIGKDAYVGEYFAILASIQELKKGLTETLYSIIEASEQVEAGAEQLAGAAQDLSNGAIDQSSAVEELYATVTDIAEQVERNNGITITANHKVKEIGNKAVQSEKMMQKLTQDMTNIKDTSTKINKIIEEIEEIASQTNLLSLNASIEAARAGEAGRGFAVVASQIGKLAEQSAQSAVNTRHLIETSIQEVNKGNEASKMTSEHLTVVMEGLEEVVELIASIQEASTMQIDAINQIQKGVSIIADVGRDNSATAEETSATGEELFAQAQGMQALVSKFKLENR